MSPSPKAFLKKNFRIKPPERPSLPPAFEEKCFEKRYNSPPRATHGVALVVVLAMTAIISVVLVAFVMSMRLESTASASYGQALLADELARGSLNLVIADLQNEMAASSVPDTTYPRKPLFTQVTPTNILPQKVGSNMDMPLLVRTSTDETFLDSGGSPSAIGLKASTVSTAAPSVNGRYVDPSRWSAPLLGTFPAASLPSWVYVTRSGITDGAGATFTGPDAINNRKVGNLNYGIGRFAYAVYDVGGLLDITAAGYPASLTPEEHAAIKNSLAGLDLTSLGLDSAAITTWRNPASKASGAAYLDWVNKGTGKVVPGDTTFLSRQDLIKAAKTGIAGLDVDLLSKLTVFSRDRNAPSAKPATPTATNPFFPSVRRSAAQTVKTYLDDSFPKDYQVEAGDPLVMYRFPLARLNWIGPAGPQNGGTAAAIQACFGLVWVPATGIWNYVGPTGTTKQTGPNAIKTLAQVVAETPAREANFFELLQAAIPSTSLGLEGHVSKGGGSFPYFSDHELSTALHVFRIGASILSQNDPTYCPIVVAYDQSGGEWQAAGIENLPYINMLTFLTGANSASNVGIIMALGLWNPHQGPPPATGMTRPKVRMRIKGHVIVGNPYGNYTLPAHGFNAATKNLGYVAPVDTTLELLPTSPTNLASRLGVDGFVDPHVVLPTDVADPGDGTAAGGMWAKSPAMGGSQPAQYVGYRLPDFVIDPARLPPGPPAPKEDWANLQVWIAYSNLTQPFNAWLEFENPAGKWIPYNYFAGINDTATWYRNPRLLTSGYFGPTYKPTNPDKDLPMLAALQPWDPINSTAPNYFFYFRKYFLVSPDPRTLRFNPTHSQTDATYPSWSAFLKSSTWSTATQPYYQDYGQVGSQDAQKMFGPPWVPSGLIRNNNTNFTAIINNAKATKDNLAVYSDPDNVRRIADSGLFTDYPGTPPLKGNPYALSTTRVADRPVILNRPFQSVAELGYVCRDYPWRTLDLFTANSADGGLMDVFTVGSGTEKAVSAKLNLNSTDPAVLQAVMTNVRQDAITTPMLTKPSDIATNISQQITTAALTAKGEIATRLVATLPSTVFSNEDEEKVKPRREAVARALSDVGQVRTWNLLIDLVAQTGRFPVTPSATLDKFNVEAEKRYWLHVAIDRYTGEVVDRQIEAVNP